MTCVYVCVFVCAGVCLKARRARKAFGGGMRQAGVIAAAGVVALEENVERLAEDHAAMAVIAEGFDATPGITIAGKPDTNILYFDVDTEQTGVSADELCSRLKQRGVLLGAYTDTMIRAVTHLDLPPGAPEATVGAVRAVLAEA